MTPEAAADAATAIYRVLESCNGVFPHTDGRSVSYFPSLDHTPRPGRETRSGRIKAAETP